MVHTTKNYPTTDATSFRVLGRVMSGTLEAGQDVGFTFIVSCFILTRLSSPPYKCELWNYDFGSIGSSSRCWFRNYKSINNVSLFRCAFSEKTTASKTRRIVAEWRSDGCGCQKRGESNKCRCSRIILRIFWSKRRLWYWLFTVEEGTCKVVETIQVDMKERKKRKTISCVSGTTWRCRGCQPVAGSSSRESISRSSRRQPLPFWTMKRM